ncbi:class I SAM-dependent methyltransferase [Christiangramia aquimixticola]|uniref:class I SAM-dependent methyltransferase n=1 Tax=Christiangramia aquimixticola TaxID=1697558 RepID=UPI003AA8CDC5
MPCSLCNCTTQEFDLIEDRSYLQCSGCKAILLSPSNFLSPQAEKFRYSLHNNDISDPGYREFVAPIVMQVLKDQKTSASGLDFGCGTGPVISAILEELGYKMHLYDPYFRPDAKALQRKYDFIVCCEVMEHFQQPLKEFRLLTDLLTEGGKLYCKTELWKTGLDFKSWHYKNDATHVFFYTEDSLNWIKTHFNLSDLKVYKKFLVFTR